MGRGQKTTEPRLWTTIANAVDAYRRRVIAQPDAHYEHVWRLIHVHEATIVTLGALAYSSALAAFNKDGDLQARKRLRAYLTGIDPEEDLRSRDGSSDSPACLSGSIDAWILFLKA